MKYKNFIFFSIVFVAISLFQFPKMIEAVNDNTEIGLNFNNDVSTGSGSTSSDSISSSTIESSTSETSQTSTYESNN
ncbi:hypothetical protein [Enterococcus caccae]|uniref:Uncharacterized protein n=1 Tax=Enterococcus caccae ATCC BAA-1240 TaxID=1158612 RepID=R3TNV1_9ENTE|nr:hypothetical protein [Enterococcus caccae]EOL43209.1 hypothetical protein UC7_02538 [Enterococcus caccae ATCC BAA-1240]EOT68391.1 hypothetical protein I580_00774 [Enterococcus caccae ATCC BAA-1240]